MNDQIEETQVVEKHWLVHELESEIANLRDCSLIHSGQKCSQCEGKAGDRLRVIAIKAGARR